MMLFLLALAVFDDRPCHASLEDCRAVVGALQRHCPALRRITGPLCFDLQVEPRIHWGMTRHDLQDLAGYADGLDSDFSYPVTFTHSFAPLSWLTRSSLHEVWLDTRWGWAGDGGMGNAFFWHEERTYWLTVFGKSREFLTIGITHFGSGTLPDSSQGCPYPAEDAWDPLKDPAPTRKSVPREELKKAREQQMEVQRRWRERSAALHHSRPATGNSCAE